MYYYTCKAVLTHILHKFYWTQPIRPGINANAHILPDSTDLTSINVNGFPPNLITCTCIVNVKLNKYSCSRLLLDNGTLPYSNTFIFNVSE